MDLSDLKIEHRLRKTIMTKREMSRFVRDCLLFFFFTRCTTSDAVEVNAPERIVDPFNWPLFRRSVFGSRQFNLTSRTQAFYIVVIANNTESLDDFIVYFDRIFAIYYVLVSLRRMDQSSCTVVFEQLLISIMRVIIKDSLRPKKTRTMAATMTTRPRRNSCVTNVRVACACEIN